MTSSRWVAVCSTGLRRDVPALKARGEYLD
jgi:hypothetical protein